ncbi:MAG: hypothetical protein HBSAPP03_06740 [Phycisphaerae bacterium]|nr:MAG: hypothetical protein HBSAPP03_06740 [Phycisphaerae bacterium]
MDGQRSLDDIAREVGKGLTRPMLEQLVAQLDDAYLLEGPRFDTLLAKVRADFDSSATLPPASSAAFAEALVRQAVQQAGEPEPASEQDLTSRGAAKLRGIFDQWMDAALKDAPNKSFAALPKAIVAPHLDYPRGWLNYAGAWGRLRGLPRPDRVVILGTNHFGHATGVCACDKGYETPLGVCEADLDLIAAVRSRLGPANADKLFQNRFDHEREHSVELQVPWVQHVFGPDASGKFPRVFGVLVHDPVVNDGKSYDGQGLDLDPFIDALRDAIASAPGTTLVVSSADLSHAGPAFGDQQRLAGESPETVAFRNKIVQHDREMLNLFGAGKPEDLIASMAWQQNPTRWCSIGNMVAAFRLTRPSRIELLNYAAAMDPEGYTFVSNASMVLT